MDEKAMSLAECTRCHTVGEPEILDTSHFHGEEVCWKCWQEFELCEHCDGEGRTCGDNNPWEEYECPLCDGAGYIDIDAEENELQNQQAMQAAEDEE
jgi:DnaJ-class molecular chaperone